MTPVTPHISEEQLTALVEGGLDGSEAEAAKEHLTGCRQCMAAYADTLHLLAQWRRDSVSAPTNVVDARRRFRPRGRAWVLAACLSLVVAAGAWYVLSPTQVDPVDPVDLHPAFDRVVVAMAAASHNGMILPDCADAAWEPPEVVHRSGGTDPELTAALAELRDLPVDEFRADTRALQVAGEITAGNLSMAGNLLQNQEPSTTEDPNILLLAGVLAYRYSELEDSERFLNRALDLESDFPEARFNLALVMLAGGRHEEARKILADLVTRDDLPLLHHRARAELDRLPPDSTR